MPQTRRVIHRLVPSMFHRRLLVLAAVAGVLAAVLAIQMARLTLVHGAVWRQKAQGALVHRALIPTARGKILDRRLRVLAADKPSYDVCVGYAVITGQWAYENARRDAYRADRQRWDQLGQEDREQLIEAFAQPYEEQVQQLWQVLCEMGQLDPAQLEHRKATVIRRVKQIASVVWDRRLRRRLEEEGQSVALVDVSQPVGEQVSAHPLLVNVDQSALVRVQGLIAGARGDPRLRVWRQVAVEASRYRSYPFEDLTVMLDRSTLPTPLRRPQPTEVSVNGVAVHVIGALRDVWKEDVQRRPYRRERAPGQTSIDRGGYLPGDRTGYWGIERSQEDRLRGIRGQTIQRLDIDQQDRHEPVPGEDVVLTLDIQLQARIQAIMDPSFGLMRVQPWHASSLPTDPLQPQLGQSLNGAAVVLDVTQGHVLAAVSVPWFHRRQLSEQPESIWDDRVNQPFLNRTVSRAYQPGSTVKPLVLVAAVTDGKLGDGQSIVCHGHLDPDFSDRYRCWIYKHYGATHGPLDGPTAIARSCNIFFYTLGRRLGAQPLVQWYDRLGLGRVTGCGAGYEVPGDLPDATQAGVPGSAGLTAADAIFMAIGQGPVRWTVLQAANSYAALARGGYVIRPTLLMVGNRPNQDDSDDLNMDPRGIAMAIQGLEDAVSRSYGTAHELSLLDHEPVFNIKGVRIYAKSGTAEAVPLWVDEDADGRLTAGVDRIARRGDHAWVICLVQRPNSLRPDYVVAVVVEFGGSGGAVAGPLANQILHAMRAEGYL